MKLEFLKGNLSGSTGTDSISYDSALGTPKGAILLFSTHTAIGSKDDNQGLVVGYYDGTSLVSSFAFMAGGGTSTGAQRGVSSTEIKMDNDSATEILAISAVSFDTVNNEIDLTVDTVGAAYEYLIVPIYGSDVSLECGYHSGTDQTITTGWQPSFVLGSGASTSSATTTNGAWNFGASDGTTEGAHRIGQADGTTNTFAVFRSGATLKNMFNVTLFGESSYDTFTSTGFNVNFTGFSGDTDEPGIYFAIKCDNDVEVITNTVLDTTTDPEAVTTTHEPEYILLGGGCDVAAENTAYLATSGANHWLGAADLSAGVGISGDYFGYRFCMDRTNTFGRSYISHTYPAYGLDYDGTEESFEATISARSGTSITFDKNTSASNVRMWMLNIGADAGASSITVNPGFISDSVTYSPSVGVEIGVTPGYIEGGATYGPSALLDLLAAPGYIEDGATYGPSVGVEIGVTPGFIEDGATYDPSASLSIGVEPGYISDAAIYGPSVLLDLLASPTFVQDGAIYSPSVGVEIGVTPGYIEDGAMYEPSALLDVLVSAAFIDSGDVYAPASAGNVTSVLPDFANNGTTYAPYGIQLKGDWIYTGAGNSLVEDTSLFSVSSIGGELALYTNNTGTNVHAHYQSSANFDSLSSYDFTGKMRMESFAGTLDLIGVTFFSDYPNSDSYYRLRRYDNESTFHIAPHGTSITSGTTDSGVECEEGVWFSFRIFVEDEGSNTRIRAKVWKTDTESEPGAWQIDCNDNSGTRLTSGTVGVAVGALGAKYWTDFEVDGHPVPLTQEAIVNFSVTANDIPNVSGTSTATVEAVTRDGTIDIDELCGVTIDDGAVLSFSQASGLVFTGESSGSTDVEVSFGGIVSDTIAFTVAFSPTLNMDFINNGSVYSAVAGDVTNLQSSVTQYGITWTFDTSYPVGQFITGDYYVVAPSGLTINSISPTPDGSSNGTMVDPITQTPSAFDSRVGSSNMALGETSYPLVVSAGSSVVSTISSADPTNEFDVIGIRSGQPKLSVAAVLTVLDEAVSPTAFRPPYSGNGLKPVYDYADVDLGLLPELARAVGAIRYNYQGGTDIEAAERQFARPWIFCTSGFTGRQVHPKQNMPDYHEYVYETIADASMLLVTDEWTQALLVGFIQAGIDNYYCSVGQYADSASCKWLSIFAGMLLGDATMRSTTETSRTDWMAYYIADGTSSIVSSIVPAGETWTGATVGWRQDPGNTEHEHLDPATEWNLVSQTGSGGKREHYRRENSKTWPGIMLAARLMGAESYWGHPAFFDYVDRWMTEPDAANYAYLLSIAPTGTSWGGGDGTLDGDPYSTGAEQSSSTFVNNMWDDYGASIVVAPGYINNGSVYAPVIGFSSGGTPTNVPVDFINNGEVYNRPGPEIELTISASYINDGATYDPTAIAELFAAPGFIDSGVVYVPTALVNPLAEAGFINDGAVYTPSTGANLPVPVSDFINDGEAYEPGVAISILLDFIENGSVYDPSALSEVAVEVSFISDGTTYTASVNLGEFLSYGSGVTVPGSIPTPTVPE